MRAGITALLAAWAGIFLAIGMIAGASLAEGVLKREAIKHECAAYDQQTGKWGWKP